jgi:bidirectional [NiFe] hydrogenase diaphorase subunit
MKRITLSIDGCQVSGHAGETILHIATAAEIHIPTLCNFPGLEPLGACRICIVEIAGSTRPVPACATLAEQGMVVNSASEKILHARRLLIELLLTERNHTCPVCVMNNNCELQTVAQQLSVEQVRYDYLAPHMTVDISHKRFGIDHNRCILCRRCVRVCDEIEGAHTWDVCGRGGTSMIVSDLAEPWGKSTSCTDCGKCVRSCPTGALFEKDTGQGARVPLCLEKLVAWRRRKQR